MPRLASSMLSEPDYRDIPYISPYLRQDLPPAVELDWVEIKDQHTAPTCVSNAIASAMEYFARRNGRPDLDVSRMFLHNGSRAMTGLINDPNIAGMFPREALKFASKVGTCIEGYYPHNLGSVDMVPPDSVYSAASYRLYEYRGVILPGSREPFLERLTKVKAALAEGLPVLISLPINGSINQLTGPWRDHNYKMNTPWRRPFDQHMVVCVGYDGVKLKFANSWGTDFGDQGYFGANHNILSEKPTEAWTFRVVNDWHIPESPGIKLERLAPFNLECRIVPTKEQVGTPQRLWFAAIYQGVVHALQPDGSWLIVGKPDEPPHALEARGFRFSHEVLPDEYGVYVNLVKGHDLRPFAGAEVFVAFGKTFPEATVQKLCVIPENL